MMRQLLKSILIIITAGLLLGNSVLGVLASSGTAAGLKLPAAGPAAGSSAGMAISPAEAVAGENNPLAREIKEAGGLIRFHVIANSDSERDQALKRAVRDAILEEVSPRLGRSDSIGESRELLKQLMPKMQRTAAGVVKAWGEAYPVKVEYGISEFPTKSYGSLVLPAGEYEAVRILIGKAEGANWWCVLFPPLCFVDIEHSTAVPVDGKPGIPIGKTKPPEKEKPVVRFWIWEKVKELLAKL